MRLKRVREKIDSLDKEMLRIFEERMKCVEEVINYKYENNLPIFDENREKIVIEKNKKLLGNIKYEKYYVEFLKNLMDVSKNYQKDILKEIEKEK